MVLAPAVVIILAVVLIFLATQSASGQADNVTNTLQNPNYPPPPSLGQYGDAAIEFLFAGIKKAENSNPIYNNPLDLAIPNWQGPKFGEGISVFSNPQEGINRGKFQLYLIGSQRSTVYNLDMTIADMAAKWTRTNVDAWATTVAQSIGTTTDVTLRDLFQGTAS